MLLPQVWVVQRYRLLTASDISNIVRQSGQKIGSAPATVNARVTKRHLASRLTPAANSRTHSPTHRSHRLAAHTPRETTDVSDVLTHPVYLTYCLPDLTNTVRHIAQFSWSDSELATEIPRPGTGRERRRTHNGQHQQAAIRSPTADIAAFRRPPPRCWTRYSRSPLRTRRRRCARIKRFVGAERTTDRLTAPHPRARIANGPSGPHRDSASSATPLSLFARRWHLHNDRRPTCPRFGPGCR